MSATNERDIAMRVAKTDFKKSLKLARKVSDAWFRCQALAGSARYAPDEHVVKIAEEAISAAFTATDFYKGISINPDSYSFSIFFQLLRDNSAVIFVNIGNFCIFHSVLRARSHTSPLGHKFILFPLSL